MLLSRTGKESCDRQVESYAVSDQAQNIDLKDSRTEIVNTGPAASDRMLIEPPKELKATENLFWRFADRASQYNISNKPT